MRVKSLSAIALGLLIWFAAMSSGIQSTPVASADGPIGGVDPVTGSLVQTFNFGFVGFQPYTQLTLSVLPPGYGAFIVVDPGVPVITDGLGQAIIPLGLIPLLGDPSELPPALVPLLPIASTVYVTWAMGPCRAESAPSGSMPATP